VKKREVFLDTHQAFIEVLAGQRAVAVNQEIVELTESVLPDIQRRIEAGKTSTIEETRSNVSVATARIGLEQARREMLAARHRLAAQWGSTKPRFASAVGDLEDAPPIASLDVLSSRLADNPRVARFGTELDQREATLARERAAAVPDVTVHGGVRQFAQSDTNAFVLSASVPIPLFNRNQGNIRAAREQIGKTKAERLAVQATISAELAEAYHAVQAARAQIDLFRNSVLPESEKALQTITEGYNAGRFSYLEFLDVQRSLVTARQQYLQALVSHQQAVARVESLTSGPLHRGHPPPNR
jgi:cobalt-zinc-cadmium efflux system outer membrane protein